MLKIAEMALQALDPKNWTRSPAQGRVKPADDSIDEGDMEKMDDGSATTAPSLPLPSEFHADSRGLNGIASSPLTNSSSSPQEAEIPESVAYRSVNLSEQMGARYPDHAYPQMSEASSGVFDPTQFARLVLANRQLVEEQQTVSAKRSQVRELRQALRYKREEESNLRTALMRKLNALFAQQDPFSSQPLMRDYELLQLTTEGYLDLESSYHDAEDELEQQEYRLGKSMERFASLSYQGPGLTLDDDFPDDSDDATSVASGQPQSLVDYLSRVGDVRLLQEHLLDLDSQWLAIMDKQKQRSAHGLSLDDESREFLRTYDDERRKMWYDLHHAQLDVNQLRSICEENGLITDDPFSLGSESTTRQSDDPLKLSVDEGSSFFFEPQATAQLSPTRFINKWMLHQLRNSSVEIHRLKSRPELQPLWDRGFDEASISRWALREWFSDDAGLSSRPPSTPPPDEGHIPTTETVRSPEKQSRPMLSSSRSVPLFRRVSVVRRLRHSRSMSFHRR